MEPEMHLGATLLATRAGGVVLDTLFLRTRNRAYFLACVEDGVPAYCSRSSGIAGSLELNCEQIVTGLEPVEMMTLRVRHLIRIIRWTGVNNDWMLALVSHYLKRPMWLP